MPWSPSFDDAAPDPRLDPYRGRAAHLVDGEDIAGYVLVESDYSADAAGGALWWRRWNPPSEFAVLFIKLGEQEPRTTGIANSDLDLFDRWKAAGFEHEGRRLEVVWLDEEASARVHDEVFAHQH